MPAYVFSITPERADALLDRGLDAVQTYLTNQGVLVTDIALALNPPTITITAASDPSAVIGSVPWPAKRNLTQARAAMKAFMVKVEAGQVPTNTEVIAAVRGIIVELARD